MALALLAAPLIQAMKMDAFQAPVSLHRLSQRTEQSALALRRLTGPVTLTPERPDVGRRYFRVRCSFESLNLLVAEDGSNLLQWWRRRELKRIPDGSKSR